MTTCVRNCGICCARFVVGGERQLTCSAKCRVDLAARRASAPPVVPECRSQTTPNRIRAALRETRAAVAHLLSEGRRARRLTDHGESA